MKLLLYYVHNDTSDIYATNYRYDDCGDGNYLFSKLIIVCLCLNEAVFVRDLFRYSNVSVMIYQHV